MTTSLLKRRVRGSYNTGNYVNDVAQWAKVEGEVVAVTGIDYLYLWVLDADCLIRKVPFTSVVVIPYDAETPLR